MTVYDAEIKIKYSHLNQGSLTQCYVVNKDSLVESILKENIRKGITATIIVMDDQDRLSVKIKVINVGGSAKILIIIIIITVFGAPRYASALLQY